MTTYEDHQKRKQEKGKKYIDNPYQPVGKGRITQPSGYPDGDPTDSCNGEQDDNANQVEEQVGNCNCYSGPGIAPGYEKGGQ